MEDLQRRQLVDRAARSSQMGMIEQGEHEQGQSGSLLLWRVVEDEMQFRNGGVEWGSLALGQARPLNLGKPSRLGVRYAPVRLLSFQYLAQYDSETQRTYPKYSKCSEYSEHPHRWHYSKIK